jgi:Reverse transcriptase (RNA-dependent DNA polymerase)
MDCLKPIPELYSGKDFSEKPFPEDIFTHDVEFLDKANTQELYARPYPISGIRAEQLKATIDEMVEQDILEPGDSPFVSPVFYVLKKVNRDATAAEGRLVFDYRKLNSLIRPLNHPITNVKDFFNQASKFKVFTLIDLKNAFLSVKMTKRASKRAAIITPFGVYKPKRSPFRLKTSPSAFCYALNHVLKDLPFCVWYMDDIVIGASNEAKMFERLKIVFARLAKYNLKIQLHKIRFFQRKLKILGVIFSAQGKQIDPEKIQAIEAFPEPTNLKETQRLLGMLCYLAAFIPHYSTRHFPVFQLLKNANSKTFQMTKEALAAIKDVIEFLKTGTSVYNVDLSAPIYLMTECHR